ncbi:MAG: efflux RND transporter periplasmic adaptor subunit [Eubacteriales bacterium]|nr:efflux RND transporter periplasmic adaptor subunit [Eubacteriales bacterium]
MEKENIDNIDKEIDKEIEELMQTSAPKKRKKILSNFKFKKIKSKKLLFVLALIVVLLFLMKACGGGKNNTIAVSAGMLEKKYIAETLSITGPIEGTDSVEITSNLHAKVSELYVKEGDKVKAGETVLLKIDTEDLEKQLQIAKGNYDLAVATKGEKQKEDERAYAKAKQDLDTAKLDYDRKSALFQTGDISKVDLDAALNAYNDAKRNIQAFSFEDGKLKTDESLDIQINNAKAEYDKIVDMIEDAKVVAPIDGTVTRVNVKVGRFADDIGDEKAMLTIENLENLQMKLNISEYSIGKISLGQKVEIQADILGEGNSVMGEITNISPTGELKSQTASERVIPVTVQVKDKNTKLIAGINARARIIINENEEAFSVPISAVGKLPDGKNVMQFILTDKNDKSKGIIKTLEVETGIESDIEVELKANPLDVLDVGYEPLYNISYNPQLMDGTEVVIIPQ